jgi:hypothetical protein
MEFKDKIIISLIMISWLYYFKDYVSKTNAYNFVSCDTL